MCFDHQNQNEYSIHDDHDDDDNNDDNDENKTTKPLYSGVCSYMVKHLYFGEYMEITV